MLQKFLRLQSGEKSAVFKKSNKKLDLASFDKIKNVVDIHPR